MGQAWPRILALPAACCVLLAISAGCTKLGLDPKIEPRENRERRADGEAESAVVVRDDAGGARAGVRADAKTTQVVSLAAASERDPLAGVQVAFPPGSLAVSTEISIAEGVPVANTTTAAALGIESGFESAGAPVAISSSIALDTSMPFAVTVPLPAGATEGATLRDPVELLSRLVIVYRSSHVVSGVTRSGVIPTSAITVVNGFATFTTQHFGVYQAAFARQLVTVAVEVAVVGAPLSKQQAATLQPLSLAARRPLVVKAGDRVTLSGSNFRPTLTLALGGKPAEAVTVKSDAVAEFVVPVGTRADGLALALTAEQDGVETTASLVFQPGDGGTPVISLAPSQVCAGVSYYDANGELSEGEMACAQPALCESDGESGCLVDGTSFKAATASKLRAPDIKAGVTIGGVTGSLEGESHVVCANDGEVGCVTTDAFKAAKVAQVTAADLRSGVSLAGVTGSLAACASDGSIDCIAVTAFKAADMSKVAAGNIKNGVTIAGVLGGYPSSTHPLSGASTSNDLVSLAASTAAGSYEWWGPDGVRYTGTVADAGTVTPTAASQSFSTSLYRQFTVAGDGDLLPANVKAGVTIFGVSGNYPSASYPLPGADSTADLDSATFDAKIKSVAAFEWFDSTGARYTGSGDGDLVSANIASGQTIFGETGSLTAAADCTSDGQIGCVTTSRYKAMDTDSSVISAWDIRHGKTAGGVSGSIAFLRNMADASTYDRSSGTGASAGVDVFDTIDDTNSNGVGFVFPTAAPTGWVQATGANWLRDSLSDNGSGGGTGNNSTCDGTEECVYKDRLTGAYWAKVTSTQDTWENAIAHCDGLSYGSYTDWRLPTQKEMLQAYVDGIWSLKDSTKLNLLATSYWSATTNAQSTTYAFTMNFAGGAGGQGTKTSAVAVYQGVCVRP